MFSKQLKKILELAKKTGDRVVIFDGANPDNSYVVMHIDRYLEKENKENKDDNENLTEEDLTDKINQEISMWKNQNKAQDLNEEDKVKKSWQIPPAVKDKAHNIE